MDVRGKVIIQSIMSEPWIALGGRGGGGGATGPKESTNNSRVDLITNRDPDTLFAFAKTAKIGGRKASAHEEEQVDLNVKCVYRIPVSLEVPRVVKELLIPN